MNGRDLTAYNRLAHGDGHEPASADSFDPQFTGPSALGEGQSFVGNSLGNVAMSFPLILDAANTDALYQLIRDIRTDLVKGNTVEYRSGGASQSTFFDMESGKLEPNFEFWLDQNARCRAQLTIWRRPYGHSGTSRVIASAVGTGPMMVTATGVLGDGSAQANLRFRPVATSNTNLTGIVWGIKNPVPSGFNPFWGALRIETEAYEFYPGATTVSATSLASGRINNQYRAVNPANIVSLGTSQNPVFDIYIPGRTFGGRYRVLANARMRATFSQSSSRVEAVLRAFSDLGMIGETRKDMKDLPDWSPIDLGEITIPSTGTTSLNLILSVQHSASPVGALTATYPFQVDGFTLVPLDKSAGMISTGSGLSMNASGLIHADGVDRHVPIHLTATDDSIGSRPSWLRGDWPTIPPAGSAGNSALVVWPITAHSATHQPFGNRQSFVSVAVRERFSYMR